MSQFIAEGRVVESVFLQHYFKQTPKLLSHKILTLLIEMEKRYLKNEKERTEKWWMYANGLFAPVFAFNS